MSQSSHCCVNCEIDLVAVIENVPEVLKLRFAEGEKGTVKSSICSEAILVWDPYAIGLVED